MAASEAEVNEILQKGIRAARRGYKDPARRLLAQVLQSDPDNEEAWMWLCRVADTQERRAECLQRVLSINPENRWAADQMASLQEEAAAPAAPAEGAPQPTIEAPSSELKLEAIKCPKCGGALELRGGSAAKTLVCDFCRSVIDLTQEQAAVVGQIKRKARPAMPIELGMEGTFDGELCQVIGWIRYEGWDDEDRWRWDEWLLASSKGEFRWLSYDTEEGFLIQEKIAPTEPFDPRRSVFVPTPGGRARVTERSPARIIALAGELTWQAKVGERIKYLEAVRGSARYSVEYTKDEIELLEGRALSALEVWRAFGREDLVERALQEEKVKGRYRLLAIACGIFAAFGCLGLFFSFISGRRLMTQEVRLTTGGEAQVVGPFEVTLPERPHRIALESAPLPTNNWVVVDVSVIDTQENEIYLFSAEFWDEEGRDSDGYWHENDLDGSGLFRPDEAGQYRLALSVEEATVGSSSLQVEVEDRVWLSGYFIAYIVVCAILFLLFASRSAGRSTGLSLVESTED